MNDMPWRDSAQEEYKELSKGIRKLAAFLDSYEFTQLSAHQRGLLVAQHRIMLAYSTILTMRLEEIVNAKRESPTTEADARNSQRLDTIGSGQAVESRSSRVRGGGS